MLKCYNLGVSSTTLDLQFCKLVTMTVRLLLVLPNPVIGQWSSHCMTDCNMGQHGPSLYEQYCCIFSNKGRKDNLGLQWVISETSTVHCCIPNFGVQTIVKCTIYTIINEVRFYNSNSRVKPQPLSNKVFNLHFL